MASSVNRRNRFSRYLMGAAELLALLVLLFSISVPLFSQAAVGTILGGVFDSSGGAIAGAQVTIIDVARGTTRALDDRLGWPVYGAQPAFRHLHRARHRPKDSKR